MSFYILLVIYSTHYSSRQTVVVAFAVNQVPVRLVFVQQACIHALRPQRTNRLTGRNRIAAAVAAMDSDGNGLIDFDEFCTWWLANAGDEDGGGGWRWRGGGGDNVLLLERPSALVDLRADARGNNNS